MKKVPKGGDGFEEACLLTTFLRVLASAEESIRSQSFRLKRPRIGRAKGKPKTKGKRPRLQQSHGVCCPSGTGAICPVCGSQGRQWEGTS